MRKLIVLALCLMLLLSGCAYLGGDAPGAGFRLEDLIYAADTREVVDMRGLSACVEVGRSDTAEGLRLVVRAEDRPDSQAVLALVDQSLVLILDGGGDTVYTYEDTDPEHIQAAEELLDTLLAPDEAEAALGQMTAREQDTYAAGLQEQLDALTGGESGLELTPEERAAIGQLQALLDRCITAGGEQAIDGESWLVTDFHFSHEDLMELAELADLPVPDGEASYRELLADAGVTLDLAGCVRQSLDSASTVFEVHPAVSEEDGSDVRIDLAVRSVTDMTSDSTDLAVGAAVDGESWNCSIRAVDYALEGADWLPEAVSPDAVPLDFDDQASIDAFVQGVSDLVGQVSGTVTGVTLGNSLVNSIK